MIDFRTFMDTSIQSMLSTGAKRTDGALERLLPAAETAPQSLHRAMRHSVFAGGKRLRPILCYEAWRLAGSGMAARSEAAETGAEDLGAQNLDAQNLRAANLGAAIEMLHTYSLIHDDLPALDDDDFRRGQPTCHKVFGEDIAILAGDALQTLAFETIARLGCPAEVAVEILREVARAVGTGTGLPVSDGSIWRRPAPDRGPGQAPGMIGGQVLDLESEGKEPTAALVEQIHRSKTGALITVSLVSGGNLARASADTIDRLRTFGENAGLAFQIVDDVLDLTENSEQLGKTAGKDAATTKATWPAVFGVERSIADAQALIADAFAALDPFGEAAKPLKAIAQYLVERRN